MNILINKLPEGIVEIDGVKCKHEVGFKSVLYFFIIKEDFRKASYTRVKSMLRKFYSEDDLSFITSGGADRINKALLHIIDFISGVDKREIYGIDLNELLKDKKSNKLFDFVQDAELIYSAFLQNYNIDLSETNLHWYKFINLLKGLPNNSRLSEIISLRGTKLQDRRSNPEYFDNLKEAKRSCRLITIDEIKRAKNRVVEEEDVFDALGSLFGAVAKK